MKINSFVGAFAVVVAAAWNVVAADEITCERYPDADSVTVDEVERVRYNPDGTYEQTDECWTKILTEKGRRSESSLTLDYSRRYGEAAIVYVGAIDANGNERKIDVSATTKDSTDNSSMSANIYDPLDRKIVCTIPGLKVGETVHVKTRRKTTKPRCQGKWADISVMEWSHPIVRSTFEVTAPAERPLRKIAIRHPLGNIVTNVTKLADGSLVHTFTATNSAQVFPEPDMPPLYTQVQNVRVSTAADWPEISKWYWDLCVPHLEKTNAAMSNKVDEVGRDIRAIFKFVSQEVRYMGLTMEDTSPGYAPHDVDVTFDNRYGVCRDKAGLLVAMLRIAGFKAFPVLIHAGAKLDPEVPQPFFNHAIVAVEESVGAGNRPSYILMDPTNENAKDLFPAYLCDKSYLVARPEGEDLRTSDVPSPDDNAVTATSSGTLMKDGSLFFESDISFTGINDTAYRHAFVRWKPEDCVKFFEKIVKRMAPGAELIRCDLEPKDMRDTEKPVKARISAKMPEMVLRGKTRDELTVPFVTKSLGMVNFLLDGNTSLEQRKFPLALDSTACVRETLSVDLSGSLGAAMELPAAFDGGSDGFRYVRRFSVTNDTMKVDRSVTISAVEFSPKAYGDLREAIKSVEAAGRKRPVFAKDTLKEANVRWMLDASETSVISDSEWISTNTVVKEVLTYEGKKSSAELKLGFNPAVGTVELVTAVVSNKDGKVYAVSDKEKNVMDCGWAAAAPRYPAGKLLVVNLPSVEIGSVISYTVVRHVTNAPAAFYASYVFDSHDPLDRKIVRVNNWRREVVKPTRLPNEPNQPSAAFWRDQVIVSSNRFATVDLKISVLDLPETFDAKEVSVKSIRDWMTRFVKVVGPGLYELPIGLQLTEPETVLKERYATRLDYIRTMCALLRGAGFEADVVFAANDANDSEAVRNRIKYEIPNVRAFSTALCRVRQHEGGFLGFGGSERVVFIGTENQYAPVGPTAYDGCDFFDPESGEFGVVSVPDAEFADFESETSEYSIREDGSVDLTVENAYFGTGVGGFRKTYSEILPEDRSRRYQKILGGIAQAASATSELDTDIDSYPAKRRFSCYIPDFAAVQGDAITIQVPQLLSTIPACIGSARQTPFSVGSTDPSEETVTIRFPEGYTRAECLPKAFSFSNPADPSEKWLECTVKSEVKDDALVVVLSRKVSKRMYSWYSPSFYELIKDWNRIANARVSHTLTVRKR